MSISRSHSSSEYYSDHYNSYDSTPDQCCHVTLDEYLAVIHHYCYLVGSYKFDEAKDVINQFRRSCFRTSFYTDNIYASVFIALRKLVKLDKLYYGLGFMLPRSLFRKQRSLRRQYLNILDTFVRYKRKFEKAGLRLMSPIFDDLQAYVKCRMQMIGIYNTVAKTPSHEQADWERLVEEVRCQSFAFAHAMDAPEATLPLRKLLLQEVRIVTLLFVTQKELVTCHMTTSMIRFNELRSHFIDLIHEVSTIAPTTKKISFWNMIRRKSPESETLLMSRHNTLINWFVGFYNLLLSKFSLYFSDMLSTYCARDEVEDLLRIDNSYNFVNRNVRYVLQTSAYMLSIVSTDHTNQVYNTTGVYAPSEKLCPIVFRVPSPVNDIYHHDNVTLCINRGHRQVDRFVKNHLQVKREDSKTAREYYCLEDDMTMFGDLLEGEIYMVIMFKGKVTAKATGALNYIKQISAEIRGQNLVNMLKHASK